jgi:hypothetical protein
MKRTENKKLFFCLAALLALVFCGSLASCLQTAYDTDLMDYVPSITPVDIKSPSFSVAGNSNILIVNLKGGAFKAASDLGNNSFLLDGNDLPVITIIRDSDTQVRIGGVPLSGGSHRLTVKSAALSSPVNRVSVQAVTGGWFPVDTNIVNNIFGNAQIWGIGYGNGKFVAVGAGGRMAAYSGGTGTWTAVLPGTRAGQSGFWDTDTIRAVAYGNGKFVAVGYDAKMALSANGTDWSGWKESAFNGQSILAITYGNEKFVAAGGNGTIRYSNSGESKDWLNAQGTPFGGTSILGLAYGGNCFVAVGNEGKVAWSADGINWTAASYTGSNITDPLNAVAYGGPSGSEKFIAVGDGGKMAYSTNGKTWTAANSTELPNNVFDGKGILSVCYGGGKFVAAGHNGKMAELGDKETDWKPITSTHFNQHVDTDYGDEIRATGYGGGMFIAGGNRYEHPYSDNTSYTEQTTAKMAYGY